MAEEIPGSDSQEAQKVGEVQKGLAFLSWDARRKILAASLLNDFGDNLSPSALREVQGIIARKNSEQDANIEDEYVKSVTDVSIWGKFPQGLDIKGEELVAPRNWSEDYKNFSPTKWQSNYGQLGIMRNELFSRNGSCSFPEAGFIATTPDPKDHSYSCLSYTFLQDGSVRDSSGRHALTATISMRMPKEKAREFMRCVKEQEDGADMAERFLQKAVPGAIAPDRNSRGIRRVKATGLLIFDEEFQKSFFGDKFISDYEAYEKEHGFNGNREVISEDFRKRRGFKSFAEKNVIIKKYSTPVGFGELPK